MANALYDHGRQGFLTKQIDWMNDDIRASLVKNTYAPNLANDQYYDVTVASYAVTTPVAIGSKSSTAGIAGGDPTGTVFTAVPPGSTVGYIVIYDNSPASNKPLIACIDTASGGPISMPTSGLDVLVQWATTGNLIFKL